MFNLVVRERIIDILSQKYGKQIEVQNSSLLRLYATMKAMCDTKIAQPDKAYEIIVARYSTLHYGYIPPNSRLSPVFCYDIWSEISRLSYVDFLTYVVPGIVCDPKKTLDIFQKAKPEWGCIEQTHHILQIRLIAIQASVASAKRQSNREKMTDIDQMYDAYLSAQKDHVRYIEANLNKDDFCELYTSINMFALAPNVLSPKSQGAGFKNADIDKLLILLTDELQLTRSQQMDLVAQCFVNSEQATNIIPTEQIYNFTHCKDMAERKKLVRQAHRLMAKIPPLELICAISTRKKIGKVSVKNRTEALTVPNDVMLETGYVYPMFKNLIGSESDAAILLMYPSVFFVRKLWADETLRNRNISIVLEDDNVVSLLKYQIEDSRYATRFDKNNIFSTATFMKHLNDDVVPYTKIFLFGNNLSVDQQGDRLVSVLKLKRNQQVDVFALLSSYVIDNAALLGGETEYLTQHLKTISLIPLGINNSSFPRRKMWVHFKTDVDSDNGIVKIYKYTLDTSAKTQAISLVREEPLEVPRSDISQLNGSIRKCYSQELMLRRAQGRTRTMAFSHEITPDIPVWCSYTFPKGKENNPRLEAYVCMPPPEEKILRGFSARGGVIQSTKKHTEKVPLDGVLDWLEKTYSMSSVQQRYSAEERKQPGSDLQLKVEISIRDEIIEKYTQLLERQNIALKTLWYLYPDLSNKYTGSDYQVLTQMMQTVIGQQRVCDITSEWAEKLLLEVYPNLNEAALWRNYRILSVAIEKAKQHGYCQHNPLEDALRQEKLRRKLFAQVRGQLVKKHLTEPELKQAYHMIVTKIQNGQHEYLGVLIRLLTGLESNIVCALRWCDMVKSSGVDVVSLVITRQISNDGKEIMGFSDIEDYICFPLSAGLRSFMEDFRGRLHGVTDETRIMDSVIGIVSDETMKSFTPAQLNDLTKEILKEFNVEENYFNIACGNSEFRKINLNKYMGDFARENFRYWANRAAKLLPAELSYLLRNRVDSTCGRYYCDFQNEASLAMMATKLSRLECLFMQGVPPTAQREVWENVYQFTREVKPGDGYRQKVSLEVHGESNVEVITHSPRGIWSSAINLVDKGGKSHD